MKSGSASVWGGGDKLTLYILGKLKLKGYWLNLAGGDGRYSLELLEKVDKLLVTDIDKKSLIKLRGVTPKEKKDKLKTRVLDITKKLPLKDESFDGVLCTGTLHLFPKEVLRLVFAEIDRVLKPKGQVIIDFATDVKRYLPGGTLKIFKNEPQYRLESAKQLLSDLFKGYKIKMYVSKFTDDLTKVSGYGWGTTGNFILLVAEK